MILTCRCGLRWVAVAKEPLPALCPYCRSGGLPKPAKASSLEEA